MTDFIALWIKDLSAVVAGFLLGAFFGILRYGSEFIDRGEAAPKAFHWWVFLFKALLAGGVGILATFLCLEWKIGTYASGFLIAMSGWGGVETLNIFREMAYDTIRRKLSVEMEKDKKRDAEGKN